MSPAARAAAAVRTQRMLAEMRTATAEYVALLTTEGQRTLIEFPDCPGCSTFAEPGEDVGEVAREALEGWLAVYVADGETPPRPATRADGPQMMTVRLAARP